MSDGAYGVRGFHGDTVGPEGLADWYRPHIEAWSRAAKPSTTLWFWNTEVGWANVHPVLEAHGWRYVETVTWDKGIAHIAGNVNGKTIRRFPVASEIAVLYERVLVLPVRSGNDVGAVSDAGVGGTGNGPDGGRLDAQTWMRAEWRRSGLPMYRANEACGVKNAATRKYLTADWLWYFPPGEMVERMAEYCTRHGAALGERDRPYFSIDGVTPPTAKEWDSLRYSWNHVHGFTNVWSRPPLHDSERLKGSLRRAAPRVYKPSRASTTHLNQKPLEFMERMIGAVTRPGDTVWEPFGGLASGSVAAVALGRVPYVAEIDPEFAGVARDRLGAALREAAPEAESEALDHGAADR